MSPTPSWIRLGSSRADDGDAKREEIQQKILRNAGLSTKALVVCQQVHGKSVAHVHDLNTKIFSDTDGLLTAETGIALGIFTADCMPIFFWDLKSRSVGLLHAGWRGACGGILSEALRKMRSLWDSSPSQISILLGPHIRECCYEVKEDVGSHFSAETLLKGGSATHLSLARYIRKEALSLGVFKKNISEIAQCTHCGDNFFSYRKNQTPQRMLSYIVKYDS